MSLYFSTLYQINEFGNNLKKLIIFIRNIRSCIFEDALCNNCSLFLVNYLIIDRIIPLSPKLVTPCGFGIIAISTLAFSFSIKKSFYVRKCFIFYFYTSRIFYIFNSNSNFSRSVICGQRYNINWLVSKE